VTTDPLRVLLVDDHASFRQSLALLLSLEPDLAVAGQAGSLAAARPQLAGVDVAILDLDLPDGIGLALIDELAAASPGAAVLILTGSTSRLDMARAVEVGASGLLHKSAGVDEIVAAVRRLGNGGALLSPAETIELLRLAGRRRERDREAERLARSLTAREREVLQSLAGGLSDKELARRLHIAEKTVRAHMVNILGKLGVESRLQALVFAVRHGLAHIPPADSDVPAER
jgi:DNA-binding NarL/FixJ family response regulator